MPEHKTLKQNTKLQFPKTEEEKKQFKAVVSSAYSQMDGNDPDEYDYYDLNEFTDLMLQFVNQESPREVMADFKTRAHCSYKRVKEISGVPSGTVNRLAISDVNYNSTANRFCRRTIVRIACSFISQDDENPDQDFIEEYNVDNIERLAYACDPYARIEDFIYNYSIPICDQKVIDNCIKEILKLAKISYD